MYSEFMVIRLNAIAHKYRDIIHKAVHDVLVQIKNTGAGAASLTVDVVDGDTNNAPRIMIHFDDYLIYLDKRKMQWTRIPDVRKLLEWAKTIKASPREASRLAWSVAWDQVKNDTWKAKAWRKKSLSTVLKELNELVLSEFDKAIEEGLQEAASRPT